MKNKYNNSDDEMFYGEQESEPFKIESRGESERLPGGYNERVELQFLHSIVDLTADMQNLALEAYPSGKQKALRRRLDDLKEGGALQSPSDPPTRDSVKPGSQFVIGQFIKIYKGTYKGFEGPIVSLDLPRSKIKVAVTIFGKETPVEVDLKHLAPHIESCPWLPEPQK
jgi:transcription antitermination factor NusG